MQTNKPIQTVIRSALGLFAASLFAAATTSVQARPNAPLPPSVNVLSSSAQRLQSSVDSETRPHKGKVSPAEFQLNKDTRDFNYSVQSLRASIAKREPQRRINQQVSIIQTNWNRVERTSKDVRLGKGTRAQLSQVRGQVNSVTRNKGQFYASSNSHNHGHHHNHGPNFGQGPGFKGKR